MSLRQTRCFQLAATASVFLALVLMPAVYCTVVPEVAADSQLAAEGDAALISISVTPANPTARVGDTLQFTATGTYGDGSQQDITPEATWLSSELGVATIDQEGLATAVGAGSTHITAELGAIPSPRVTLTVVDRFLVSIEVSPMDPTVLLGETQQFTATGIYNDNSTEDVTTEAAWSSDDTSVATIELGGLAMSLSPGTTQIVASIDEIASAAQTLTVASPHPEADFAADPLTGSPPLTVAFTDLSQSEQAITEWFWDFGDGNTSTVENPVHTYSEAGAYTVSLMVTDEDGDADTEVKGDYITVTNPIPEADFSADPQSGTPPLTVTSMSPSDPPLHDASVFTVVASISETSAMVAMSAKGTGQPLLSVTVTL